MTERLFDDVYRIPVPLSNTPLKELNAYLIRGERNLLIDTGLNAADSWQALRDGLDELGARAEDTDIFLTHLHADHCGNAWRLQRPGTRVYISAGDLPMVQTEHFASYWSYMDALYSSEGFPAERLARMPSENVARAGRPSRDCDYTVLSDGETLRYGGRALTCVSARGHTPGQMCLFEPESGAAFLADHILFDITPNITTWPRLDNALETYMSSLERFRALDIRRPLPGHRGVHCGTDERIDTILAHHGRRLEEMLAAVESAPGATAFNIASRVRWKIRAACWDDFPVSQQWFATGETLAHLRCLQDRGSVERRMEGGTYRYFPAGK